MTETSNVNGLVSLLKKFKDPEKIFNLSKSEIEMLPTVEKKIINKILKSSDIYISQAEEELEKIKEDATLDIITIMDDDYPKLLKDIFDPPILLYVKGDREVVNFPSISIVGSRFCTEYGRRMAFTFSYKLASMGFTIVSGMAMGIDEYAHKGAIESNGRTVAVLGSGLYYIYPQENKSLYYKIIENGAVVSEFPLFSKPERYNFPRRNRIISGLALGTIVVEARMRSGALITSSFASEQGREVFAIPGPLNSETSKGANKLIKDGAKLVQTVDDVLEELNFSNIDKAQQKTNKKKLKNSVESSEEELSDEEKFILKYIDYEPKNVEEIIKNSKLKANIVERTLMMLEIKGIVTQMPGHRFRLIE